MAISHRSEAKNLWTILFRLHGSIWCSVLPFCFLNCAIMLAVELLAYKQIKIAFSPAGHGLMTLIVSFLVISKVNLSYERYICARRAIGQALSSLRELNQLVLTFTQRIKGATQWRAQCTAKIVDLMDCMIRVIKDDKQAAYLARNDPPECKTNDDPMVYVQALRSLLYNDCCMLDDELQLMERIKFLDMLNEYVVHYRNLLMLASTPLPFPLVQMGRTFLLLWTFSIPLVLRGVVDEIYAAMAFVFFLTYGFIGLELCAMKMMHPFGDGVNDLNVTGMKEATIIGMERDSQLFSETASLRDRRLEYSRQKPRPPMVSSVMDDVHPVSGANTQQGSTGAEINYMYHSMTHG